MVLSTITISGLLSGTVLSVIMDLSHSWSSVTRIVARIFTCAVGGPFDSPHLVDTS